jgi:hypothetical protein
MGACPGNEESAGVNYYHRCPIGNRQMRRILNQAANAAAGGAARKVDQYAAQKVIHSEGGSFYVLLT